MKEDAEMWAMAYTGAMLVQALGRAAKGTPFTEGHIKDMDGASRMLADRIIATVSEKTPKKGK